MFWNKNRIPDLRLEKDEDKDLFTMEEEPEEKIENIEEQIEAKIRELESQNQEEADQEEVDNIEEINTDTETIDYEEEEEEQLEDEEETPKKKSILSKIDFNNENTVKLINKVLNILVVFVLILGILITTDVILVSRTGKGPYFALKTKTYEDGGTKEYYGIGYKVIKYNEEEGRKDTVLGSWSIKYDTTPLNVTVLDLALEFNNNFTKSLDTYMNKYLQVSGKIEKIEDGKITLIYKDEENKYTTKLICNTLNSTKKYKKNDTINLVGTLYNYSKDDILNLEMKNCYLKK